MEIWDYKSAVIFAKLAIGPGSALLLSSDFALLLSVGTKREYILSSAKSGPGTGLLLSHECLSHDTTYFPTSVRTLESMLYRGSNIRVKVLGGTRTNSAVWDVLLVWMCADSD